MHLKKTRLKAAFDLVKISSRERDPDQTQFFFVDFDRFERIIKQIQPDLSDIEIASLFKVIDLRNRKLLEFSEFMLLADLLNIRVSEIRDRLNLFERKIPKIYNSKASVILKRLVKHE